MAALTLKDIRRGRVTTFVTKMEDGVKSQKPEFMFTKLDGRKVFLRTLQYSPGGRIQHFEIMKHKKQILDLLNSTNALPGLKFTDTTGNITVALGDISATEEFGGRNNRGDVAEIIYSAAIAARFLNREVLIKPNDVEWVLRRITPNNVKQRHGPWTTETEQKGVYDTVFWSFSSPIMTVKTLSSAFNRSQKDIKDLVKQATDYANSELVKANIKSTGANNKTNIIEVMAEGTFAKSVSKIDVKVKIDNVFVRINSPVLRTSVSSAQGGGSYTKQRELFRLFAGVEVSSSAIKQYTKTLSKGIPAAILKIYLETSKTLDRRFRNLADPVYDNIAKGIVALSTKKVQGVQMTTLRAGQQKLWGNGALRTGLEITARRFKCEAQMISGQPTLSIKDTRNSEVFLRIRLQKMAGNSEYYTNIIEKGPNFDRLVKVLE